MRIYTNSLTENQTTENEWLQDQIELLPDALEQIRPSVWAEANRYLPPSVTPLPGYYRYDVSPPLREIVDCMDVNSPVREVSVMKGAQIGATVGILENTIGYLIDVVKSAPCMMMTADQQLAQLRLESYIVPMILQSGLSAHIQSNDTLGRVKSGATKARIEWTGGGFLMPVGALSAAKLRSVSIKYLLEDEIDAFPQTVGKDGDPAKLAEARTKAYHNVRKILRLSTPLLKGTSRIEREFLRGDQRRYWVPCKRCNAFQVLEFQGRDLKTGHTWGLTWETDEYNNIQAGSVQYKCRFCGHLHSNADKSIIIPDGQWRPSARPASPDIRSYHLSAMYAPANMYPWDAIAGDWLQCWDIHHDRVKNVELLQEFYNNNLGRSFVNLGDGIQFSVLSQHRRHCYKFGELPNNHAVKYCESPILVVTCAVDVHKTFLAVGVFGWTRNKRAYLIEYLKFEGDCEQLENPQTWGKLSELIEDKEYTADDGKRYRIALTLVDAGWSYQLVCEFCEQYAAAVYPIVGREFKTANLANKEFKSMTTTLGTLGYVVNVDRYKDKYAASLKRKWRGDCVQSPGHMNLPSDINDRQLKEYTVESKRPKTHKETGKVLGYEWFRPGGSRNELWDLTVYNSAALDMIAHDICMTQKEMEFVDWLEFWRLLEVERVYYET